MAGTFEEARPDLVDMAVQRYKDSGVTSDYFRDRGLLLIPVMGPVGTPPVVVRVHAPFGVRETKWHAEKQGGPPLMPAAANTQSGDAILTERHSFGAPRTDSTGQLVFSAAGAFTYVQPYGGRTPEDSFPIDSHPFPTMVDALGEFDINSVLRTPGADPFVGKVLDSQYNREVIDSRVLSGYNIIG